MNEGKTCPKCGGKMEKGHFWGFPGTQLFFSKGEGVLDSGRGYKVSVLACSVCGFMELYKETGKKKG